MKKISGLSHPGYTEEQLAELRLEVGAVKTEGGCWLWTRYRTPHGYGRVAYKSKAELAHRVSWFLANGPIPDGMGVLHSCDNPPCVNPAHLFLGTSLDNNADCRSKGRHAYGERNGVSKLTRDDVIRIRAERANGRAQRDIAYSYGVSQSLVSMVTNGKLWVHV